MGPVWDGGEDGHRMGTGNLGGSSKVLMVKQVRLGLSRKGFSLPAPQGMRPGHEAKMGVLKVEIDIFLLGEEKHPNYYREL